ncbi:uncharacterized protein V1516DRAFT_686781 [Lipomyces oligophaga]|uniref:uncharacterized protein n=1 Tax=Lipomyces oligophaga TaxID=45792 RepID=UPI0034CEF86B
MTQRVSRPRSGWYRAYREGSIDIRIKEEKQRACSSGIVLVYSRHSSSLQRHKSEFYSDLVRDISRPSRLVPLMPFDRDDRDLARSAGVVVVVARPLSVPASRDLEADPSSMAADLQSGADFADLSYEPQTSPNESLLLSSSSVPLSPPTTPPRYLAAYPQSEQEVLETAIIEEISPRSRSDDLRIHIPPVTPYHLLQHDGDGVSPPLIGLSSPRSRQDAIMLHIPTSPSPNGKRSTSTSSKKRKRSDSNCTKGTLL